MLLGLVCAATPQTPWPELCVIAEKPCYFSTPLRIATLQPTDSSVQLLSIEEGITVEFDRNDNGVIVTPLPPHPLYLTPNLPQRPGFSVNKVKLIPTGDDQYESFFDRGRGWEEWKPNVKLY